MIELSDLQIKILKYVCKTPNILVGQLAEKFKLSNEDLIANLTVLRNLNLIERDTNFRGFVYPTLQGKNYFKLNTANWLYSNLLAIIDLILSIIAIIVSIVALNK